MNWYQIAGALVVDKLKVESVNSGDHLSVVKALVETLAQLDGVCLYHVAKNLNEFSGSLPPHRTA